MATRLERLLFLLETGSSDEVRSAAAVKIADIINYYPFELNTLLNKVYSVYSLHLKWETRVAATKTINGLLTNHSKYLKKIDKNESSSKFYCEEPFNLISNLNVKDIFFNENHLLSSSGAEFITTKDCAISCEKQRDQLKEQLGFNSNILYQQIDTLIENNDFEGIEIKKESNGLDEIQAPNSKRIKTNSYNGHLSITNECNEKCLLIQLINNALISSFNQTWEIRHGSICCLREIFKTYVEYIFYSEISTCDITIDMKNAVIENIIIQLIKILILDKFVDYSDLCAVAPIRETCAQALSYISLTLNDHNKFILIQKILDIFEIDDFQCKFSSFIALKYLIMTNMNKSERFINLVIPKTVICLSSFDPLMEDAKSVAMNIFSSLIPHLTQNYNLKIDVINNNTTYYYYYCCCCIDNNFKMSSIYKTLWSNFYEIDEISSPITSLCNSILNLSASVSHFSSFFDFHEIQYREHEKALIRFLQLVLSSNLSTQDSICSCFCAVTEFLFDKKPEVCNKYFEDVINKLIVKMATEGNYSIRKKYTHVIKLFIKNCSQVKLNEILMCNSFMDGFFKIALYPFNKLLNREYLIQEESIGGCFFSDLNHIEKENSDFHVRKSISKIIVSILERQSEEYIAKTISYYINLSCQTNISININVLQLIIIYLVKNEKITEIIYEEFLNSFMKLENHQFNELITIYQKIIIDIKKYIDLFQTQNINIQTKAFSKEYKDNIPIFNDLITSAYDVNIKMVNPSSYQDILSLKQQISSHLSEYNSQRDKINYRLLGLCSIVKIHCSMYGSTLSTIIRPLMDLIRFDSNKYLQIIGHKSLFKLMVDVKSRIPCPNDKIITNLVGCIIVDHSYIPSSDNTEIISLQQIDQNFKKNHVPNCIGSINALKYIFKTSNQKLFDDFSFIRNQLFQPIQEFRMDRIDVDYKKQLISSLILLNLLLQSVTMDFFKDNSIDMNEILDKLVDILESSNSIYRYMASITLCSVTNISKYILIKIMINRIIKMNCSSSINSRRGVIEFLWQFCENMGHNVIEYIVFFIVSVMHSINDSCLFVRQLSSSLFGIIIKLLPLINLDGRCSDELIEFQEEFNQQIIIIKQLINPIGSYDVTFSFNFSSDISLRQYQLEGIHWLLFLNKFKLNGALCDDMGLGKTLQTLCTLAQHHNNSKTKLKSLIICPPTLIDHWINETTKYFPSDILKASKYDWNNTVFHPNNQFNLIVTSYDTIRRLEDDTILSNEWNYCILDEGHIIRNSKSKIFKMVVQIKSQHRLVLTGTPIQNNVYELWTIFEFLMPGYLGTSKIFQKSIGKNVSLTKSNEKNLIALEDLHKKLLPFILRRTKDEVLKDLPPKIIQDYICELSPLQKILYDHFESKIYSKMDDNSDYDIEPTKMSTFQSIHYARKLCNHPLLVYSPSHELFNSINDYLNTNKTTIDNIEGSCKLLALRQILIDCGIITDYDNDDNDIATNAGDIKISNHRALIFFQSNQMIDIFENTIKKDNIMNKLSYLRLDSTIPVDKRHVVCEKFNNDVSIDILSLTTSIGGLGLNLTGADVVIFYDHDWNPAKDVQAMDRAHRLGQKKTVNVFRILTKGTIEERIMNLQNFKLKIAKTVISDQNSSVKSMNTNQLLDLITESTEQSASTGTTDQNDNQQTMVPNVPIQLKPLWDSELYEKEFNLEEFLQNIKS